MVKKQILPKRVLETANFRSSQPEVFLGNGVLIIGSKFTGEHPWQNVLSIKLLASLLKSRFNGGVLQ